MAIAALELGLQMQIFGRRWCTGYIDPKDRREP